jgi:hypothetical protein
MEKTTFNHSDVINPGDTIALGDVHGQVPQFVQFIDWVQDSGARVIFLADLIDRAKNPGDDLVILDTVEDMILDPAFWGIESCISLIGNHESLMLNAIDGHGMRDWVHNGGDWENLNSLSRHAEWIRKLPYYVTVGNTLFSHSGGIYGEDPQKFMHTEDLREEFVWSRSAPKKGSGLEKWSKTLTKSVFGHSPGQDGEPYRVGDAICVDSGCFFSGVLTAYNSTQDTIMQFSN